MIILVCGLGSAYTLVVICRLLTEGVPDKLNHFKTPTGVVVAGHGLGESFDVLMLGIRITMMSSMYFNVPCIFLLDFLHFFLHFQSRMSQVALLKASTGCSAAGAFTAVTWAPSTASSVS